MEGPEDPFQDVPILHRASADLYVFDTETELFVIQESNVSADLAENAEFDSKFTSGPSRQKAKFEAYLSLAWIIVRQGTTPFISAPVDAELNAHFDMVSTQRLKIVHMS